MKIVQKTNTHTKINLLGLKISFKRRKHLRFNKTAVSKIVKNIDKNKKNYLYFDWPFGGYVFDEMLRAGYKDINLIKFSLFEIFNIENRFELNDYICPRNSKYIKFLKKYFGNIDGLLVTHDWFPLHKITVEDFKKLNIPTINILHEGVFQNDDLYYDQQIPVADVTLTWGELQRKIFIKRGYPSEKLIPVGSIKLNSYKNFTPSVPKSEFLDFLNLKADKKIITYCCQLCDGQWGDQELALERQRDVIKDLIDIANKNNYNLIIRNCPASPSMAIPPEFASRYSNQNVAFEGKDMNGTNKSMYKTKPADNLYYSDIVIGMNTTMQLEACLLKKPVLVAKYFDFDTKWGRELGLPICTNKDELENLINKNINKQSSLIQPEFYPEFCKKYGYNDDLSFQPLKNIERELLNFRK